MRLSLQAVEAMSDQEFKASVLGAYERGERAISVPRLQRLAKLYDVPVDQLLPHDEVDEDRWGGQAPETQGAALNNRALRAWDGNEKITIDLAKLNSVSGPERDLLRQVLEHDPGAAPGLQRPDDHHPRRGPACDRLPVRGDPRRHEPPARRAGPPRNRLNLQRRSVAPHGYGEEAGRVAARGRRGERADQLDEHERGC